MTICTFPPPFSHKKNDLVQSCQSVELKTETTSGKLLPESQHWPKKNIYKQIGAESKVWKHNNISYREASTHLQFQ